MKDFKLSEDLIYNKGLIKDPCTYIKEAGCS